MEVRSVAQIGRWNGHTFEVGPTLIRSFTGLTIKGGSNIDEKNADKNEYVTRKNGKPKEIGLTLSLLARLGCDVRAEAMAFVDEAYKGAKDYFYVGDRKLLTCSMMLTEAEVSEVEMTNGAVWTRADVKCSFMQCGKDETAAATPTKASGTSSGGSKKQSVKTTTTVKTSTSAISQTKITKTNTTTTTTASKPSLLTTVKNSVATATSFIKNIGKAVSTAISSSRTSATKAKVTSASSKATLRLN